MFRRQKGLEWWNAARENAVWYLITPLLHMLQKSIKLPNVKDERHGWLARLVRKHEA
jgi:hypothetical protein